MPEDLRNDELEIRISKIYQHGKTLEYFSRREPWGSLDV